MLVATRLFVGNLPVNTEEKDLHSVFSDFGEVSSLDLKAKPTTGNDCKKFAFISISASNADIESCIKHFSNEDFKGHRLYVTRARESFLERLQKEREQTQQKEAEKGNPHQYTPKKNPVIKISDKSNINKRKIDNDLSPRAKKLVKKEKMQAKEPSPCKISDKNNLQHVDEADKKGEAERKRMESLLKKRQEFKEKQRIIKTGLTGIDKIQNKKVIFQDESDDSPITKSKDSNKKEDQKFHKNTLFDDDNEDNDDDLNFDIKKQFEGKKGQQVLDLQSRYKSDKRFTLDERFIDEEEEVNDEKQSDNEQVEIGHADEKVKQLNILQNVLGITLKTKLPDTDSRKIKSKPGMLRYDPQQPDHAKFLVPVETKPESSKRSKRKAKDKQEDINNLESEQNIPKVEVSKEQFYKVSESLKETIAQPTTFSLRSLFGNNDDNGPQEQNAEYITLETPKEMKKVKNPLDPTEKNPFVYDSSDSETEEPLQEKQLDIPSTIETKAVWKENLFFSKSDSRLKDGLAFFSKAPQNEMHKERRELKSVVKKRIYNKDRKNQIFKKKIGGRRKSMKKPYKNKN